MKFVKKDIISIPLSSFMNRLNEYFKVPILDRIIKYYWE